MKSSSFRAPIVLALFSALLGACAQQTGTLTRAAASYLVFVGDAGEATVSVDGRAFALTQANAHNHFEVSPGVHRVKVEKQGRILLDRQLLLSDRQTMEVAIP